MKKIISFLLSIMIVLSITACGGKKEEPVNPETPESVTDEIKEENPSVEEPEKEETKAPVKEEDKGTGSIKEEKPADKTPVPENKEEGKAPEKAPEKEEISESKPDKTAGNVLLDAFKAKASGSALSVAEGLSENKILPFTMVTQEVVPGYLAGFDNEIHNFKEGAMFAPMMSSIPFVGYVFTLESSGDVSDFINTLKSSANLRWNVCSEAEEMVYGSSGNKVFFVMTNKNLDN